VAFAVRLTAEYWFYQRQAVGTLGVPNLLRSWLFTIMLLVLRYLYGL